MRKVLVEYSDALRTALDRSMRGWSSAAIKTKRPGRSIEDDVSLPPRAFMGKIQGVNKEDNSLTVDLYGNGADAEPTQIGIKVIVPYASQYGFAPEGWILVHSVQVATVAVETLEETQDK